MLAGLEIGQQYLVWLAAQCAVISLSDWYGAFLADLMRQSQAPRRDVVLVRVFAHMVAQRVPPRFVYNRVVLVGDRWQKLCRHHLALLRFDVFRNEDLWSCDLVFFMRGLCIFYAVDFN